MLILGVLLLWLLQLIIRSHEGSDVREKQQNPDRMDEGYTIDHAVESGKLVTLFSSPNCLQSQVTFVSFFVLICTMKPILSQFAMLSFFFNSCHLTHLV